MKKETFNLRQGFKAKRFQFKVEYRGLNSMVGLVGLVGCFLTHTENCQFLILYVGILGKAGKGILTCWPSSWKLTHQTHQTHHRHSFNLRDGLFDMYAPYRVSGTVYAAS